MSARWMVLALAVAAACTACSHVFGGSSIGIGHELTIADPADPTSLNPLLAHDQDTIGFNLLITQTLVGLAADNRLVPILVTRVPSRANGDISPDGRTIVYHLRRNVRFADGRPLTASDVAFTYRAIVDARNPVLSVDAYRRIARLQTPDPHTVIVRLRAPWNAAVRELFAQSDFAFGILPAHAFSTTLMAHAPWEEHAFGTGPFRVSQWRRGDRVVLLPNPYFSPHPKLVRLELRMIPNFNATLVALRTGEVDVGRILPAQVSEVAARSGLRVGATQLNGLDYLALQTSAQPTDDVRVRRAIADAIDAPVVERAFHGRYPRAGAFLPPVFAWHDLSLAPLRRNTIRAAAQLDAAGWHLHQGVRVKNGKALELLFVIQGGGLAQFAAIVQRQLAAVGVDVALKAFPPAIFNGPQGPLRTGDFNIAGGGWVGGADPEQSVIFACDQVGPDGNNDQRFCDQAFDAAFRDQAVTPDERRRARDFIVMQRIVYDRMPIVPLDYTRYFDVVNSRVSGFARNMLGYPVGAEYWDTK